MTTVVIPYIMGPDKGAELRYALRSIDANLIALDGLRVIILGDLPTWCKGVEHVPSVKAESKFKDSIVKLRKACEMVKGEFVYMYDDTYFINPCTMAEIRERTCMGNLNGIDINRVFNDSSSVWQNHLKRTVAELHKLGRPVYNYETHTPRVYDVGRLVDVLDSYSHMKSYLLATLYFNLQLGEPPRVLRQPADRFKLGVYSPMSIDTLRGHARTCRVLNHMDNLFQGPVLHLLRELFPLKCQFEK